MTMQWLISEPFIFHASYAIHGDDENSIKQRFIKDVLLCYMIGRVKWFLLIDIICFNRKPSLFLYLFGSHSIAKYNVRYFPPFP